MKKISALIYDCDGVMFESRRANLAYYNNILKRFFYSPVDAEDHDRATLCHTASSAEVLQALLRPEDLSPALSYAAGLDYREFIPRMTPEKDLQQALTTLALHYPLAVATNRGRSIVPILDHFGLREKFAVVVTCQDVPRPKPAPDMLFAAAERLGTAPENCLFIGDSELDRAAAEKAGVLFAGYGSQVRAELRLSSHLELVDYLLSGGNS